MTWMDRWAAHAQRKSDERAARWQERQRERARSGQMTVMDRLAARAQRKIDEREARWREVARFSQLVPRQEPVKGPDGIAADIIVDQTGYWWLHWWDWPDPARPGPAAALIVPMVATWLIWRLVFHRAYTVHVQTYGHSPMKISVRLPDELAAYRAAAELISRYQVEGAAALQSWRANVTASA